MTDYEPAGEQLDAETERTLKTLAIMDEKLRIHDIAANSLARANAAEELAEQAYATHVLGLHDGAALGDALTEWGKWR